MSRGICGFLSRTLAALAGSVFLAGTADATVVLSTAQTANISCSGGVCAPTAKDAVLNVADLENLLASGSVTVTTTGSGVQAVDIRVADGVTWPNGSTLTLEAYKSIAVNAAVSLTGAGGLSLATNNGGTNGALSFVGKGQVTFANLSSALSINGASYMLENSVKSLAQGIGKNPSGDYALAADFDASKDGTYSAAPIGTTFNGIFEGLGNTISNLSVVDSKNFDYVGLFAQIGSGTVENLALAKVSITGDAEGSLRKGKLQIVGGLAGESAGTVSATSVSGAVKGGKLAGVGGLVGSQASGTISRSHSSARAEGAVFATVGGLAGAQSQGAMIVDSYATGDVKVSGGLEHGRLVGSSGGGLVGASDGLIRESFAQSNVTGGQGSFVGGLAGFGAYGVLKNCYATGAVVGAANAFVGGLIGTDQYGNETGGQIADSYSVGAASGGTGSEIGGFAGRVTQSGSAKTDYWDTTTSGTNTGVGEGSDAGITGLTTTQLQSGLPKGFSPKAWGQNATINHGLPYLLANPPPK